MPPRSNARSGGEPIGFSIAVRTRSGHAPSDGCGRAWTTCRRLRSGIVTPSGPRCQSRVQVVTTLLLGAQSTLAQMQIMTLDGEPHATVWNRYLRADFATWEIGQDCQVHSHQDAVEIFVFLDGECEMTVGDETQVVGAGQAVYVGPNVPHRLK